MGKKYQNRRDFFKNITGKTTAEPETQRIPMTLKDPLQPDQLFEKYSRKQLSGRSYSEEINEHPDVGGGTANRIGTVTSNLTAYSGTWSEWEAAHLLRRLGYGAKYADVNYLLTLSVSNAVDYLMTFSTTPTNPSSTPLNHYNNSAADSSSVALGASWTSSNLTFASTSNDSTVDYYRELSLQDWHWGLWLNDGTTLREKMVQFWYHLIPVNFDDVRNSEYNAGTLCNDYMSLLRTNALGGFDTLIQAIAKSPAMLVYLSGQFSTASQPNENFGRELMELFTLGKVPTQNYTEPDIQAAAKVFSGWRVSSFNGTYPFTVAFNSTYHNTTNKTFSSNFGSTTITGLTGTSGANEFATFFSMMFSNQGTTIAKYLCRRLYRFFVYYDIDANVESNVITGMANTLISNSWSLLPVLKELFKSQHFFDMVNRGVMIKSPFDFVAGTLRTFGVNTTAATGTSQVINQYAIWQYFQNYCNSYLEQGMGLVPNVSGWKAYYQTPSFYQNWMNTNTIQRRTNLLTTLITGFSSGGMTIKIDPVAFVQQYPSTTIQDPDLLVSAVIKSLLPIDLDPTYKATLKTQNLLLGQSTNSYWTTAWNNYVASPTTANLNTVKSRLVNLVTAIIQLAEYQLM